MKYSKERMSGSAVVCMATSRGAAARPASGSPAASSPRKALPRVPVRACACLRHFQSGEGLQGHQQHQQAQLQSQYLPHSAKHAHLCHSVQSTIEYVRHQWRGEHTDAEWHHST